MKLIVGVTCICLAIVTTGCNGNPKVTPASTTAAPMSTSPCPLVTDADLTKLNPILKRAGDEWQEYNGSIYCEISFGVNLGSIGSIAISGKGPLKPFELLEVRVLRADFPVGHRLPRDLCTNGGYSREGECRSLQGIGDFAFFIKISGRRFGRIPYEGVRSVSGPYEIMVVAEYWKGGDPGAGAIELAKKLAARYH